MFDIRTWTLAKLNEQSPHDFYFETIQYCKQMCISIVWFILFSIKKIVVLEIKFSKRFQQKKLL